MPLPKSIQMINPPMGKKMMRRHHSSFSRGLRKLRQIWLQVGDEINEIEKGQVNRGT